MAIKGCAELRLATGPAVCACRSAYHAVLPNPQIGHSALASVRLDSFRSGTSAE